MAVPRSNPVGIAALPSLDAGNLKPQIDDLMMRIASVDSGNQEWLRKQRRNIAFRFGERKQRRIPWVGASNVSVPLIDGIIRRWRPGIASLILDADPVAFFTAQEVSDFEPARIVEPFFTFYVNEQIGIAPEVTRLADILGERGHAYSMEGWTYRTELQARVVRTNEFFPNGWEKAVQAANEAAVQAGQEPQAPEVIIGQLLIGQYKLNPDDPNETRQIAKAAEGIMAGAEFVRLAYRTVLDDRASWKALDPINVITPPDQDPEDSDFFCIVHRMSAESVRHMLRDGHIADTPAAREAIERMAKPDDGVTSAQHGNAEGGSLRQEIWDLLNTKAGVQPDARTHSDGPSVVYEVFCRLDLDGDGFRERARMWYFPATKGVLSIQPYAFPFDGWPVTLYKIDPSASRPIDCRGLPEMLLSFQKVLNAVYNMRQDAGQIVLAPVLAMRNMGPNYQKGVKWHPGAIIPVQNTDDIKPLIMDLRILGELLREQQQTQTMAEAYVGVFDASLTNVARSTERRTATEVNAIQGLSSNIFGLDAKMFQVSTSRSLNKIWALYEEFGPEELFFRIAGEEKPVRAIKADIAKNYDIRAAGTPSNTQKQIQVGNLFQALQLGAQDPSGAINMPELMKRIIQLIDPHLAKAIIRSPEEMQNQQTIMQAIQALGQQGGGQAAQPF